MNQQDAEEYTQSLGQIVAGSWRQVALAKRLGVPKALGLTTEQWVNERLGGYVKMSIAERREAVLELAAGGHSNREIGAVLGVDEKTVRNDGAENSAGDERKPNNGAIAGDEGAEFSAPLDAVAALAAGAQARSFDVLSSSNSVEWYTPPAIVELVSQVLGGVDIDPCWHPESPVKATTTYVLEQDGLSRDWRGRVYLNPPYGREIDDWIEKLVGEHSAGRTTEAIALLPARVDTEWFRRLDAFPGCFLYGRLTFANAENPAPFPCAAVYLGNDVEKFAAVFNRVGGVWVRLEGGAS